MTESIPKDKVPFLTRLRNLKLDVQTHRLASRVLKSRFWLIASSGYSFGNLGWGFALRSDSHIVAGGFGLIIIVLLWLGLEEKGGD